MLALLMETLRGNQENLATDVTMQLAMVVNIVAPKAIRIVECADVRTFPAAEVISQRLEVMIAVCPGPTF